MKVVLAGEGADEIFCGYESYIRYLRIYERLWQPYRQYTPGPVREAIAQAVEYISRRTLRYSGASDLLVRAARDRHLFWGGAMTFWETQKKSLLDLDLLTARLLEPGAGFPQTHRDLFDTHELIRDSAAGLPPQADELARMTKLELDYRLPELLLMRMDKMTMAHSVEARVPFLDHRLVELACALPAKWKISGGIAKSLLKDAVRGTIPDRAIDGRKKGFGAPISDWAKHELGFRMEKTIVECRLFKSGWFKIEYIQAMFREHRRGRQNFAARLWVLYNLASWYDRWIEPMPFSTGR